MAGLFLRQFWALFWKNWIVMSKHPWLNTLRCFIMPVAYGIFLAVAQLFLNKPNNFGLGTAIAVPRLADVYDGKLALLWADGTNGTGSPSAQEIINTVTRGFSSRQLAGVRKLDAVDDIPSACPQNFNLFSECFAAVAFNELPAASDTVGSINYTLRADAGLFHIDVTKHNSDYEQRLLPLQWAVDSAIIELRTGTTSPTPREWPFTQETNDEQFTEIRLSYIRGLRTLLVLALFICYVGISYQLPGSFSGERANLLTAHLKVMGLLDSARIISWHISISLAYLPAWVIVSIIWHFRIFTATNIGIIIVVHLLLGFTLASWSFFVATPFGKSPQLAAVASTFLSIVFAILALVFSRASTGAAFVFTLIFPPGFYIFAIRAICGWEVHRLATDALQPDPDSGLRLLPLIIAAIIDVFLWPWLATLWESRLYDARNPSTRSWWSCFGRRARRAEDGMPQMAPDMAISVRNLGKDFKSSFFKSGKGVVTAVSDLSIDVPKFGIYVLLGSNGAGKSTTMSILAGLLGRTRGTVTFEGGIEKPPRGTIGIVPQKNVLFPELTCFQTLRVWKAVKRADGRSDDDIEQLLRDCDLGKKIHYNANALSGGQKRKLQLAIGLIGGSKIVLVDECTSGVDPLSRRALWRTLSSFRNERTVVFTTHFLDEADLLADHIAVLKAPGTLVASGTPVTLKSNLGEGYIVTTTFAEDNEKSAGGDHANQLLDRIRALAPLTYTTSSSPHEISYHLKLKEASEVQQVLELVEASRDAYGVANYSVNGTSIEDIFLGLMHDERPSIEEKNEDAHSSTTPSLVHNSNATAVAPLELTNGRRRSPLSQAFTIFHKRVLIAKRSWLTPTLSVLIAVAGACIPTFFLNGQSAPSCVMRFRNVPQVPLYLPLSPLGFLGEISTGGRILESPPGIVSTLGNSTSMLLLDPISDNATFVNTIDQTFIDEPFGGVSVDTQSGNALLAWEATPPGLTGLVMLNLVSNILYNSAQNNASGPVIQANLQNLPMIAAGTLVALKWVAFFGAAMAVYPAFFSLYVAKERRAAVQAMQLSNGLADPVGMWLGHLLFDSIFAVLAASIIIIIFATTGEHFVGLGLFWVVLVLYGIVGALFSYCVSLIVASPLAAFALAAGYQVVMFVLYLAAYLLVLTYAKTSEAGKDLMLIHYTMSLLAPVASPLRASFVSVNLFSLLCDGSEVVDTAALGSIQRYGGPIAYLFVYGFILFGILVWVDSGSVIVRKFSQFRKNSFGTRAKEAPVAGQDVKDEAAQVSGSTDALRVMNVVKAFDTSDNRVVDDVSFGVSKDTIFALLGPNGAGKTTTFNVIRGDVIPDEGDVLINGMSIVHHPRSARLSLGVCPQFTAIDSQLTVREHLLIYGRLKGLTRGAELQTNVDRLMRATALHMYADRLASALSGGNQRKLSLAIALIGNPSVVLIDEFSTGIDAKMKRDMWGTLRNVAVGKAIVITTHSMEEASALANKVGILAKKMLAVGTTDALVERYATYEVHFTCRTRDEVARAQELMAQVPGARMADDVATRFAVPIVRGGDGLSLAQLFAVLARGDLAEYAVERAGLESVFLKVIRENNVAEEDRDGGRRRWLRMC
ncbi:P-loop containing nucleoside triphosphate hydrolase protein [Epithele typhae]|uniref:P-loop containing nucleoside triphosphate hydrolase protein n=1 Tax=Epithele typhae TaxID=378194 RepID=UPI0020081EE5|nr:P-loop containing nucleoside triphosphate hydrolase protein [Epithele typhae]KAH9934058.1 P-loop containing nucleoside triphosphate hydrolase protein [Epithele typhae]